MSRVQVPFLPDPGALSPTVQPVDTYFQPAARGVAGAPVGQNPVAQIASALGQFDSTLQQFYFGPKREEMIQQQKVDAQAYKDRFENFKMFSSAVGSGQIHHGDNPWLQAFTKELYAKDAVNTLSVRAAELSDRQDILNGTIVDPETGETKDYGSADQAFAAAFSHLQQEILADAGGEQDHFFRSTFQGLSQPVRERSANQFAQSLRRHNVETAVEAYKKDLNNQLENLFGALSLGDGFGEEAAETFAAEITRSLRELTRSNLLPAAVANETAARAFLEKVLSVSETDPRSALRLLEVAEEIETSPGSKLTDIQGLSARISAMREQIENDQYREEDRAWTREQRAQQRAYDKLSQGVYQIFQDNPGLDDIEEILEQAQPLMDEASELGVRNPQGTMLELLRAYQGLRDFNDNGESDDLMRQVELDYALNELTPQGIDQIIIDNKDILSRADARELASMRRSLTSEEGSRSLPPLVNQQFALAQELHSQAIIEAYTHTDQLTGKSHLKPVGQRLLNVARARSLTRINEWYRENPEATPAEIEAAASRISEEAYQQVLTEEEARIPEPAATPPSGVDPDDTISRATALQNAPRGLPSRFAHSVRELEQAHERLSSTTDHASRLQQRERIAELENRLGTDSRALYSQLHVWLTTPALSEPADVGISHELLVEGEWVPASSVNSEVSPKKVRETLEFASLTLPNGHRIARAYLWQFDRVMPGKLTEYVNPYKTKFFGDLDALEEDVRRYQALQQEGRPPAPGETPIVMRIAEEYGMDNDDFKMFLQSQQALLGLFDQQQQQGNE